MAGSVVVVVDTTALFSDVMMSTTHWTQLLSLSAREEILLAIPEVVLRETARHWFVQANNMVDALQVQIDRISRSKDRLGGLGINVDVDVPQRPEGIEVNQLEFLRGAIDRLAGLRVSVLPLPEVSLAVVLERDLAERKPFSSTGKGFRDALVWESVKQLLQELKDPCIVYFVSGNSTDYCLDGSLHPSLIAEIEHLTPEVRHVGDLKTLLAEPDLASRIEGLGTTDDELSKYMLKASGDNDFQYEEPTVGEIVASAIISAAEDLSNEEVDNGNLISSGLDFTGLHIPQQIENPTIDVVECDEQSIEWQTYETYDDTTLLVQASVLAHISLDGFAYKSELSTAEEDGIHILEWDWNSHMAHVSASVRAKLVFQLRVEVGVGVEDVQLETVEPTN